MHSSIWCQSTRTPFACHFTSLTIVHLKLSFISVYCILHYLSSINCQVLLPRSESVSRNLCISCCETPFAPDKLNTVDSLLWNLFHVWTNEPSAGKPRTTRDLSSCWQSFNGICQSVNDLGLFATCTTWAWINAFFFLKMHTVQTRRP